MLFPAGKYYIGDLTSVMTDNNYVNLLENTNFFQNKYMTFKGEYVWAHKVASDCDTYFYDENDNEYCVTSDIMGIIPASLRDIKDDDDNIIEFHREFEVSYLDGVFHFGDKVTIDTNKEDVPEYFEDDDDAFGLGHDDDN